MKIGFISGQKWDDVDLYTAISMASGEYEGQRWRASVHVIGLNEDGIRKHGVEAWIYPRQIRFGQDVPDPARVQISGLSVHDVDKARERLTCYAIAISIADFVNRAAAEGMDLGKAGDSGLLWESTQATRDAIEEDLTLLTGEGTEFDDPS